MSKTLIFTIAFISLLSIPFVSNAGINIPWSTTYNCPDWNQFGDALSCAGISKKGDWVAKPENHFEQITSAANNPAGGGGKGQRHWIGDGTNNNSGGTQINFNSPQSKFWMRWYMRWEKGFKAFGDYKTIYGFNGTQNGACFDYSPSSGHVFVQYLSSGDVRASAGWGVDFYPSKVSDGSWVLNEIYVDASAGRVNWWINENLVIDANVQFKGPLSYVLIGSNQKNVSNGKSMYIDYDDIAFSNTGYIGPVSGGGSGGGGSQDTTAPSVSLTNPSSGQTVSGNMAVSANASDNTGVAGVQFKLNGQNMGSEDTSAPYSLNFDTTAHANGSYALSAVARDAAGNQSSSGTVNFTISNTTSTPPPTTPPPASALFSESFEDGNFSSRGWYDNTNMQITSAQHASGSTQSIEFRFLKGATTPTSGSAMRKLINETDSLYVSYDVKYSSNWVGSNHDYHPHEFFIMTNEDGKYDGMALTHLTVYIEQNALRPLVNMQDSDNIDTSNINNNLVSQTEARAIAGCNGSSDNYGNGDCYQSGVWRNDKHWLYDSPVISAGTWHKVEAYIKLNSIVGGIGQQDGVIQYWLDGNLLMDYHDVVFRTGQHPNMKFNQFIIAPYIGDGSPIDQTFWVDNLSVATSTSAQSTGVETPSGLTVIN